MSSKKSSRASFVTSTPGGAISPTSGRRPAPDRLDRPYEDPLLYELFPELATDVGWTLTRTARALASLGNPHERFATLHVGGTNGKGSVTATLASIMTAAGRKAGCYTSPHLVSFGERIRVDGTPLSEGALKEYAEEVREVVSACGLTFFEAVTVLALHAFAREGADVVALEVGLGGRLDATNVVRPEVSAVTNVGMDHTEYLGETLASIAVEKAGIMKPGVPFVTAERDPEILALLATLAAETGAPMEVVHPETAHDVRVDRGGTSFWMDTDVWGRVEVTTPLVGRHQALNAALAVAVCQHLPEELRPGVEQLLTGIARVTYHGRDEVVVLDGRTWLFDVAHNPAGMRSLVDTLERLGLPGPCVGLVGILADKDWRTMLNTLGERCAHLVLTQPPTAPPHRRWPLDEAADALSDWGGDARAVEDFAMALEEAVALAGDGTVVVTGSVHTVGSALRLLGVDAGA